ncbi:MAG: tRNA (adenosine(37)-N6)-threonylcarbamoyltransferase complex dimerization subunit type 1 TsaB [Pirellulaceae bacterium]
MFTLAIETSSKSGSVALLKGDEVAQQRQLDPLVGSARTLVPAIEQIVSDQQLRPGQLNLIAVSTGPGSFTGLRVGMTTAKTLAYALSCDILGVDTLDAIAAQVPGAIAGEGASELHAVIDAQRRELFLARYEPASDPNAAVFWKRLSETQIVAADRWLGQLTSGTIVTGPALKRWLGQLPASVVASPEECWTPQAATIGRLGLVAWRSGRRDDLFQIMPTYLRPSYADEKVHGHP